MYYCFRVLCDCFIHTYICWPLDKHIDACIQTDAYVLQISIYAYIHTYIHSYIQTQPYIMYIYIFFFDVKNAFILTYIKRIFFHAVTETDCHDKGGKYIQLASVIITVIMTIIVIALVTRLIVLYQSMYVSKYVCMIVCMNACKFLRMDVCFYVRVYDSMYICMFLCVYVCFYTRVYDSMYACMCMYVCLY